MSNLSLLHPEPRTQVRAPSLINRSLWLTILLALGLIATLLFILSARTLALPSDTLIQQRIENTSLISSTNSVTGTYGERITVTLRFTVAASTVMTGPVYIVTRFQGITGTPSTRIGARYLDTQGPTPIGSTPPLALVSFVTNTVTTGSAPNLDSYTYLTWTVGGITTTVDSYVYELAYQVRLVYDGLDQTNPGGNVSFNGGDTRIYWNAPNNNYKTAMNNVNLDRRTPDLGPSYSTKTYRAIPEVQGNATVTYTLTLKNGNNTSNFSPAYNVVTTDTLDPRLTYVDAFPVPDSYVVVPGQGTVMTWTPGSLNPNTTWVAYITATLPPTMAANTPFLNTAVPMYSSLPEPNPDKADYAPTVSVIVAGGITGTKQAFPLDNVRIGDSVTYTIKITVNPGIYLNNPIFTDTLPKGFHYIPGTFNLSGNLLPSGTPITSTANQNENLSWAIDNVPLAGSPRYATVTYVAGVTGVNSDSSLAYSTSGEISSKQNAINAVQASWQDEFGTQLTLLAPWNSTTRIAQPYLNNNNFGVTIVGWDPFTATMEVGSVARYDLSVRNTGQITAYEVVLSNLLPDGVSYQGAPSILPLSVHLLQVPSVGSVGTIQFIIDQLPPNTTAEVTFNALVENTARPGDALSDQLSVFDYSSQPGGLYDGNTNDNDFTGVYDRHYGEIAAALPTPKVYSYTLLGLTAIKTDVPDPVLPGQVMTYFIAYSNTSAVYAANNVQIIDTYDPLLTFGNAVPAPSAHDPATHKLTWNAGTLNPNSGNAYITALFNVATGVTPTIRALTNTITSDSDAPAPAMSRYVTTTLVQPMPTISLDDKGASVTANGLLTYTLIYSNAPASTGATTGTFTITLDYAPYTSFITYTATPANPPGPRLIAGNGTIFTDTLTPGISRTVQLHMQVVQPLPYNLTSFTSTATIYQPSVDVSAADSEETPVVLPLYQLVKARLTPDNPPVSANESLVYVIAVTNTGSVTGTNIVITDVWDPNTYNPLGSNWNLQGTYGVYTTIASLPPGASVQLATLAMNVTSTLPANAQVIRNIAQLTSQQTTQQQTIFDTPVVGLYIQKSHTPDPVFPGEVMTYTIAYAMYGTPATSPRITDTLPAAVTYLNCYTTVDPLYPSSCTNNGGKVVWSWSTLPAGYSGMITVVVQAPNTEWITLTNTYASNSASGAPYRDGPPDLTYVGRPHLSISKRASTAVTPAAPGDLIIYTLTYTNSGSYKATNVVAHDTVPVNTTFSSCSGAPCSEAGGIVDWTLGEIPISTTRIITMVVRVNPTAGTTNIVNNVYSLSADRNVVNENTPPAVSTPIVRPELSVVKSAQPAWIALGGAVTYTVRYTNTGGGTFTTLNFTDTIDNRVSIQTISANCVTGGQNVYCTDANLAPGQSRQFTITVGEVSLSNNDVVSNFASYLAVNQTEVLPEGMSNILETPASNIGAAADFSGTPITGPFPLNVVFTNLSTGTGITSCAWNFGDSGTSNSCGATVNHTYLQEGTYTVSLTIHTVSGNNTRTRPAYITTDGAATFGVSIGSPQPNKSGARGTQVPYTLIITNTGNVPDSYTLSLPGSGYNWVTNLNILSTGTLAPQSSTIATATVNIPAAGPLVDSDVVTVTATSQLSTSVTSHVVLRTSTATQKVYLPLVMK